MALSAAQRFGYLERIGLNSEPGVDLAGLEALADHHLRSVAFENISVLLGETPSLEHHALYEKIVERGRGGYCFELNSLFSLLLGSLGFRFTRLMARVLHRNPNPKPSLSHKLLRVYLGEQSYLVDVGFGGLCPRRCLPIPKAGQVHELGRFRIVHPEKPGADGRQELRLEAQIGTEDGDGQTQGEWTCIYAFPLQAYAAHDYVQPNFCIANMPNSIFVRNLRCTLAHGEAGATSLLNDRWAELQPDLRYLESKDQVDQGLAPMDARALAQRLDQDLKIRVTGAQAESLVAWLGLRRWESHR